MQRIYVAGVLFSRVAHERREPVRGAAHEALSRMMVVRGDVRGGFRLWR